MSFSLNSLGNLGQKAQHAIRMRLLSGVATAAPIARQIAQQGEVLFEYGVKNKSVIAGTGGVSLLAYGALTGLAWPVAVGVGGGTLLYGVYYHYRKTKVRPTQNLSSNATTPALTLSAQQPIVQKAKDGDLEDIPRKQPDSGDSILYEKAKIVPSSRREQSKERAERNIQKRENRKKIEKVVDALKEAGIWKKAEDVRPTLDDEQ